MNYDLKLVTDAIRVRFNQISDRAFTVADMALWVDAPVSVVSLALMDLESTGSVKSVVTYKVV